LVQQLGWDLQLCCFVRRSGCLRLAWHSCSLSTCYASHTKFLTGSADLRLTRSHTSNPDILQVYAELERGSRNHLRAFYRWKQSLDVSYEPTHLSPADFENIGRSPKEMCH
jgi:hypothetical protein